jgi:hypothetical protein
VSAEARPNDGKNLEISVDGARWLRIPIRTKVVMPGDVLADIVTEYAAGEVKEGDLLFITEKIVGITQGRSFLLEEIQPRKLAFFLSKYVTRTPYGIGLGMPGRRGDFYRIAGEKARAIDGPTEGTMPPYDRSVVLGPARPREVAHEMQRLIGGVCDVAVVDINDLGGNILGSTLEKAAEKRLVAILKDNPLGQGTESTPMGIIRPA